MKRRRLPRGITKTPTGYLAAVMVRGVRRSSRFAPGTPLDDMRAWLERTRRALRGNRPSAHRRHTLAADIDAYLTIWHGLQVHDETRKQRTRYLRLWASVFGHRNRHALTTQDISTQLAHWRDHGLPPDEARPNKGRTKRHQLARLAPATTKKLRDALYQVYRVLDRGLGLANPVADVVLPPVPPPLPRGVPMATIDAIFKVMPASMTRDHLALVAYAGLRPSEIARILPGDVGAAEDGTTLLHVRTAKGGPPTTLPLLPEASEALARLIAAKTLTRYHSHNGMEALQRACARAGVPRLRVYDLRHSFGTAILEAADQRTAQAALRHASIQTTHRYTLAAVSPKVRAALTRIGGRDVRGPDDGGSHGSASDANADVN